MCVHLFPFSLDYIFLVIQLKAFETPSLRAALGTAKDNLLKSQQNLDTMRTKCITLEEQMIAKEQCFTTSESVLKQTQCELEKSECYRIEKLTKNTVNFLHFFRVSKHKFN